MKHRRKGCSDPNDLKRPSHLTRLLLAMLAQLLAPTIVSAQPPGAIKSSPSPDGPIIEFRSGDFAIADGPKAPNGPWRHIATPNFYSMRQMGWRTGNFHSLTARFHFDRSALGDPPFALYIVSVRNQFTLLVNGIEMDRNFAHPDDQVLAWYRPYLISLPSDALKPGINEIEIRTVSQESLGVGRVMLGPDASIRDYYLKQFFWQITAPLAANFAMLVIGLLVFLLWLGRRHEIELLWLSISTVLWFLRNYQYFAVVTPFDMTVFNTLTVYATYFGTATTAAFYMTFAQTRHRTRIIPALLLGGIPLALAHTLFNASNLVFYIPTTMLVFWMAILGFRDLNRFRNIERGILGFTMMAMPVASLYDMSIVAGTRAWNGNDFYVSVFGGVIYCTAFLISFGKRALDAFTDLGDANVVLERRIAETRAELEASEASRNQLIVANALAGERGRLMQEMHDGIGSNLITALAVARQQKHPPTTINVLRKALADLKITVDSLEPVEGDLVALIGNLRHRMASDLRDAGIACKWEVQPCGPLPWLDATNALHVLRIFQESIGNILAHSQANEIRIGCREQDHGGVPGVLAYIADNGVGFADDTPDAPGKGLAGMRARARSLHGVLTCETGIGSGTVVRIWLPYTRIPATGSFTNP